MSKVSSLGNGNLCPVLSTGLVVLRLVTKHYKRWIALGKEGILRIVSCQIQTGGQSEGKGNMGPSKVCLIICPKNVLIIGPPKIAGR